jgi:hypothetical protein
MNRRRPTRSWQNILGTGLLGFAACAAAGCQIDVAGQTLPSPYYIYDDVQYFPAGPEFQLEREAAEMRAVAEGDLEAP